MSTNSFIDFRTTIRTAAATRDPNAQYDLCRAYLTTAGIRYTNHAIRAMYLTYAFIRGIPYRNTEPTARDLFADMGHYRDTFLKCIAAAATYATRDDTDPKTFTADDIRAWMAVPETDDRQAKRAKKETAARLLREARRAAFPARDRKVA